MTEEWKERGIKEGLEYAILASEISKASFGLAPSQYKELKGLKSQDLRDNMTDLELIFTMLGEASTTEIARQKDAQGFVQDKEAAKKSGAIAGNARKQLELESGKDVVSKSNHLVQKKNKKLKE